MENEHHSGDNTNEDDVKTVKTPTQHSLPRESSTNKLQSNVLDVKESKTEVTQESMTVNNNVVVATLPQDIPKPSSSSSSSSLLYSQLTDTKLLMAQMSSMQLGPAVMSRYMLDTSLQSRGAASGTTGSSVNKEQVHEKTLPTSTSMTKKQTKTPEQDKRVFQYKIILLGHQEVGKTSLRKCFESEPYFFKRLPDVRTTSGVEVAKQHYYVKKDAIDLTVADFAGQESYHSHTYFLTSRALFVLVWKISAVEQDFQSSGINESEEQRLCTWIAEVYAKYPSAQLILIATHLDELRVQGQRSVEMILTRVERKLETFLDRIIHASAATTSGNNVNSPNLNAELTKQQLLQANRNATTTRKCRFVGNFAVSCKTRQIIAAGNAHRGLSGSTISALARLLAELAHDACMHDVAYPNAMIPASHDRFIHAIQRVKHANAKRILMQLSEFALLAQQCGIASETELLRVATLMHANDVIYLIHPFRLIDNLFIVLRPEWLSRMSASLFSFAHILHTPLHLRSSINGLEYVVSEAEHADMALMSKGFLRWPLARLLFTSSLKDLTHNYSFHFLPTSITSSSSGNSSTITTSKNRDRVDDVDVAMCLYLLQSMEIIYPVEVKCDDASIVDEERPKESMQKTTLPVQSISSFNYTGNNNNTNTLVSNVTQNEQKHEQEVEKDRESSAVVRINDMPHPNNSTIIRYYIPSLAPKLMPATLRRLAPILLHHGVRLQMEFNLLPDELWWRLQARMHHLLHAVTMYQPLGSFPETTWEEEMMLLEEYRLKEADEEHNRWRDAMWLSSSSCRVLVYREGRTGLAVFTAENQSHGAEVVLQALEDHLLELLQEYAGVTREVYVACPNTQCEGWVEAHVIMQHDKVHCPVCHTEFSSEAFLLSEHKANNEQQQEQRRKFPESLLKETSALLSSCLTPTSSEHLCQYLGIPFVQTDNSHAPKTQEQEHEKEEQKEEQISHEDKVDDNTAPTRLDDNTNTADQHENDVESRESSSEVHIEYLRALDKVIQAALFKALVERTEAHARLERMIEITPSQVIF